MTTTLCLVAGALAAGIFLLAENIINRLGRGDDPAIRAEAYALSLVGAGGVIAICSGWKPGAMEISLLAVFLVSAWRLWRLSKEVEP